MTALLDDFLIRAMFAGVGVAFAAGPLGCFIVWRRMAYFGDATAHAAILGVALALALSVPVFWGSLAVALIMAVSVVALSRLGQNMDSSLGVLSHSALALGLVAISFVSGVRVDLDAFLFGDILAVGRGDLGVIWLGALGIIALLAWRWRSLLTATLNADLAAASGISPRREELILAFALAGVVAVAIKVVGALLIGAMLLIPAASARGFARSPETMAIAATLIGTGAALAGLWGSYILDTPAGPSIVSTAALVYPVAAILGGRRR